MISQDDIDAMCGDLTDDERDSIEALLRAGAKVKGGVVSLREFPAQDMRKVIEGGLIAWGRLWQMTEETRLRAIASMGVFDEKGQEKRVDG